MDILLPREIIDLILEKKQKMNHDECMNEIKKISKEYNLAIDEFYKVRYNFWMDIDNITNDLSDNCKFTNYILKKNKQNKQNKKLTSNSVCISA